MISIAEILDSTTALCLAPAAKPNVEGNVSVEVSANNGYDFTRESGRNFTYVPTAYINDIYPKMGPIKGGTHVHLSGSGFRQNESTLCRFQLLGHVAGSISPKVSSAMILSDTDLICTSPSILVSSNNNVDLLGASVQVSTNGVDFTPSHTKTRF
eukprot:9130572-Ditylum_brightwellii.AAC.1